MPAEGEVGARRANTDPLDAPGRRCNTTGVLVATLPAVALLLIGSAPVEAVGLEMAGRMGLCFQATGLSAFVP